MVKVDIISGFLGAGKTTFLKKCLAGYADRKVVIIENEFGDIGIDGEILKREGYQMVEISTGCICCLMQGDFLAALGRVIDENKPDIILIEPTGISILSDIVKLLRREPFRDSCELRSLVTVVDCENYLEQSESFGEFFKDQITNATQLLLSKIQNVTPEIVEEVAVSVRQLNPRAPVVAKNWDDLSVNELLGFVSGDTVIDCGLEYAEPNRRRCREKHFATFAVELPGSHPIAKVKQNLDRMKGGEYGNALRGKGFVSSADGSYAFSFTNGSYEIHPVDYEPSGRVCFIGVGFDKSALESLWKSDMPALIASGAAEDDDLHA
ncbi:MAG: GTP-binding protein [Synergistaceae bacterium]|nr:GTP-binding protein [Synergistaceae bacterium]